MKIYIIMEWDQGEKYPTGIAYWCEHLAKEHCKGSDGWTEYEEVELQDKAPVCDDCREGLERIADDPPDCICDTVVGG